jgi:predicted helicase
VEQFKKDLPAVLDALRAMIEVAHRENTAFRQAATKFLAHAQEAINPSLTSVDVREMLIQHILTEDIFSKVFGDDDFHRHNNVAKQLYALEAVFFTGDIKKRTLRALDSYYSAIRAAAAHIGEHHEKQHFLKAIYENFYRVYNPKAADRLGVFYTPNEVVRFMISGADWLCQENFGRNLIDKDVQILDPATGTGTFISELLEHFRGSPKQKLKYKYQHELHANEVAILPYYVANLNIEATYAALAGEYVEFPNLCFMDTLENVGRHTAQHGTTLDLFGAVSAENVSRIKRQNAQRITVIIGNPPYRANQMNENDNNKNRVYPVIDEQIKKTYIATSSARKTKCYDMYVRFIRWASNRLSANGVLAFIVNRGFVDKFGFDGFRKTIAAEFNVVHVVDLGGDVRENPQLSGPKHNVFGIQTGVAICFLLRQEGAKGCRIFYSRRPELETAEDKLVFLGKHQLATIEHELVRPDVQGNWVNVVDSDFADHLPMISEKTKAGTKALHERAIFKLYSLGISTNRDEWVYDDDPEMLKQKMRAFVQRYGAQKAHKTDPDQTGWSPDLKWSRNLKRRFLSGRREPFAESRLVHALYRPFNDRWLYDSDVYIDEVGAKNEMFPPGAENLAICFSGAGFRAPYCVLAVDGIADLHFGSSVDGYQQTPLYRYENGQRVDNITNWALEKFRKAYTKEAGRKRPIGKEAVFHYVYAVLHDPTYRDRYLSDLKRGVPHIPFYPSFWMWAEWGQRLIELHTRFRTCASYSLTRTEAKEVKGEPTAILKAFPDRGKIVIDSRTTLSGVPLEAWAYRLGSRNAIEWVLNQWKAKKPKDPAVGEIVGKVQTLGRKEELIDHLKRVITTSVETTRILNDMREYWQQNPR